MSNGSSTPSSDPPPSESLWVVDIVAPLPPGRVRLVAADAAARLNLPAEKLVSLLENRIGPVTKPLPRPSADRVADVLNTAGAEVEVRTARASDGPPSAARSAASSGPPPGMPGRRAEDAVAEGRRGAAAPTAPDDPGAEVPERRPAAEAPPPVPAESEHAPDADRGAPTAGERTPAGTARDGSAEPSRAESPARTNAGAAAGDDPARDRTAASSRTGASGDEGAPTESPARERAPADDPWSAMEETVAGRPEDEAMLGRWREASPRASRDVPQGSADAPSADASAHSERPARSTPQHPPRQDGPDRGDRPVSSASSPGSASPRPARAPSAPGAAGEAPREEAPSREGDPAQGPAHGVRVTPVHAGSSAPGERKPGTQGIHVRVPQREPASYDAHEDEDDEAIGFGMRDPFAEAERRERAMRRWVLGGALIVAAILFLVLQWAYSRPGLVDRVPPPYESGLVEYRRGAFVSAARAWSPRAEAGDAQAMYMLGYMAEIGQGRPWSNREAAGWYRQAAERGHADAQLRLAALHLAGMGVDHDVDAALEWTLRAARSGHARAQLEAARLLAGLGRHHEAAEWLREASVREPEAAGWWGVAAAVQRLNPRSE